MPPEMTSAVAAAPQPAFALVAQPRPKLRLVPRVKPAPRPVDVFTNQVSSLLSMETSRGEIAHGLVRVQFNALGPIIKPAMKITAADDAALHAYATKPGLLEREVTPFEAAARVAIMRGDASAYTPPKLM